MADNLVLLRHAEAEGKICYTVTVLKMRGSDHDKDIRELIITKKGAEIRLPFSEYSGLLSGSPMKTLSDAFVEAFRK